MFVDRSRLMTTGAVALGVALTACADPTLRTDLRPDGPPEVLSVLVMDDAANGLVETATFCKLNDAKRPGLVPTPDGSQTQVCSDTLSNGAGVTSRTFDPTTGKYKYTFTAGTVTDALPMSWYARIQFDELIDPNVEELVENTDPDTMLPNDTYTGHINNTLPVTLQCGANNVDVPYDGYYSPAGNSITWPLGPSLVIKPNDPTSVATSATCTLKLKPDAVHDKDGNKVPTEQLGPWTFQIAPLQLTGTDPSPLADASMPPAAGMEDTLDPASPIQLTFNAPIDDTSLSPAEVKILKVADCTATTGTAATAGIAPDPMNPTLLYIYDSAATGTDAWVDGSIYKVTFADNNTIADQAGGPGSLPTAADMTFCFKATAN